MTHLPCSMSTDAETTVRMGRAESGNCGRARLLDGGGRAQEWVCRAVRL